MYPGTKKDDSVTSILLFVFNAFLNEQGIREIPLKTILEVLKPFQKSETSLRMGLSRGVRNGLLANFKKGNQVYYGLTDQALDSFKDWWDTIREFQEKAALQQTTWDGSWNMVLTKDKAPEELWNQLQHLGYGRLEKDLWVSPFDHSGKITPLADGMKVKLYIFQSRLTESQAPAEMAKAIWPIDKLHNEYSRYLADLNKTAPALKPKSLQKGEGLPFLHLFGLRIFGLIQADPQLPLELLPADWAGLQAAKKFFAIREQVLPGARDYINKALEVI